MKPSGFQQVITYVQSGNVIFDSRDSGRSALTEKLEKGIHQTFGFHVPVIIRDGSDFQRILDGNPFIQQEGVVYDRLYVTFLTSPPAEKSSGDLEIPSHTDDEYRIVGNEIYLHCPGGYGRTILSNTFFEKKLGQIATTRNWKTVVALSTLANSRNQ